MEILTHSPSFLFAKRRRFLRSQSAEEETSALSGSIIRKTKKNQSTLSHLFFRFKTLACRYASIIKVMFLSTATVSFVNFCSLPLQYWRGNTRCIHIVWLWWQRFCERLLRSPVRHKSGWMRWRINSYISFVNYLGWASHTHTPHRVPFDQSVVNRLSFEYQQVWIDDLRLHGICLNFASHIT